MFCCNNCGADMPHNKYKACADCRATWRVDYAKKQAKKRGSSAKIKTRLTALRVLDDTIDKYKTHLNRANPPQEYADKLQFAINTLITCMYEIESAHDQ